MKPVSIRFKCFGPYMEEQYINFKDLSNKGIFLISGETGSGKTTILDAICYALFGRSSGGLRGDIEVMRCKSASPSDNTFVEYIFESAGNTYRFHRELKYGRKNMSEYDGCEILKEGSFVPMFENPKKTSVNKKAEEIIGLTYDQFCQVVILPQGKFEKLLVSDSEDKEKILTSLFHADKWNEIVSSIKEKTDAENKRLDLEYKDINSKLDVFGCESLDDLKTKNEELSENIASLSSGLKDFEGKKAASAKVYEQAIKDNELFKTLNDYKIKFDGLERLTESFEVKKEKLKLSERADSIRENFTAFERIKGLCKASDNNFASASKALGNAQKERERAEKDKAAHENNKGVYEGNKLTFSKLSEAVNLYSEVGNKKASFISADNSYNQKSKEAERLKKVSESAAEIWEKARKANDEAIKEYTRISSLYSANIAGILAKDLALNSPCPVCGSTEHPSPAKISVDCNISKDDVNAANDKITETSLKLSDAKEKQSESENNFSKAKDELQRSAELLAKEKAEYEAMCKNLIPGIEDSAKLQWEIKNTEKLIKDFEAEDAEISFKVNEAGKKESAAKQHFVDAENAKKENDKNLLAEKENWEAVLLKNNFADESEFKKSLVEKNVISQLREEISAFESNKKAAEENLMLQKDKVKGINTPDMLKLKEEKDKAELEFTNASAELTNKRSDLKTREELYKNLSKRFCKYQAEKAEADDNTDFSRKLNPSSGMSLQRYVLGIMLSSITVTANELLKNVHGGKYQLLRSYEASGNKRKAGLELDILDTGTSEKRSVTTLSGGEKFLVALCLAIGLSTVVQSQSGGTTLEAMFIDEGFGSLDDGSIDDALDVLQSVQRSHGLVGIISHVDKLSETIPTRLDIVKGVNGNSIKLVL